MGILTSLEVFSEINPSERQRKWMKKLDVVQNELTGIPHIQVRAGPNQPSISSDSYAGSAAG